jgi:hypothetical protein
MTTGLLPSISYHPGGRTNTVVGGYETILEGT